MQPVDDKLTYRIIGLAMEVHRELGPGLDEAFYHELLAHKLTRAEIAHQVKPRGYLRHRGMMVDEFVADLIIDQQVVSELKVLWGAFIPEHLLQVICYLKFWRLTTGLLFDFGKESLAQKRVPNLDRPVAFDPDQLRQRVTGSLNLSGTVDVLCESMRVILDEHGLGYRDTTYQGLLHAELMHRNVPLVRDPVVSVRGTGSVLGEARLPCLLLPGQCVLFVTALREARRAGDRAVLQTYLRHLDLPSGFHLNFGRRTVDSQFVTKPISRPG